MKQGDEVRYKGEKAWVVWVDYLTDDVAIVFIDGTVIETSKDQLGEDVESV